MIAFDWVFFAVGIPAIIFGGIAKGGFGSGAAFVAGAILALVLALVLAALLLAGRLVRLIGVTGTNVITRVLGLILGALAVQYVLDGILAVFNLG